MLRTISIVLATLIALIFSSCAKRAIDTTYKGISVNRPSDSAVFAIIGDYGQDSPNEAKVANMVKSWNPEFVITVGDNNYFIGSASSIVKNVGKHYGDFIYNPDAPAGKVCNGKAAQEKVNRFFPAPGNHDNYAIPTLKPYLDYFTLPGDEKNYDFVWGPIHFFSLNSGKSGNVSTSVKNWLQSGLSTATEPFKLVYFHHPPYSPGPHGNATAMQFPYDEWGVDAILTGHEHFYVRLTDTKNSKPLQLIIGNSGNENLYNCNATRLDKYGLKAEVCDNSHFGAIKVRATKDKLVFEYYTVDDTLNHKDVSVISK